MLEKVEQITNNMNWMETTISEITERLSQDDVTNLNSEIRETNEIIRKTNDMVPDAIDSINSVYQNFEEIMNSTDGENVKEFITTYGRIEE